MDSDHNSKPRRSWLLTVVLLMAIVGLFIAIAVPNFVHGGPGKITGIIGHLRQIDAAKQQWAIEHGMTNATQLVRELTPTDLAPYLLPDFTRKDFGNPICGERYSIKRLEESPEALITRNLREYGWPDNWKLPKGTIIRFGSNGEEYILPGLESKPCKSLVEAVSEH